MPFTGTSRRLLAGIGATFVILALAGATVAWGANDAPASIRPVVAALPVIAEPPAPSTSAPTPIPTPTSTSTSTSSASTSTTLKPRPVTTTTPQVTTTPPPTAPRVTQPLPVAQPAAASSTAERCAHARQWVAEHGLALPAGWGFRCPGQALVDGTPRWGMACWNCEGTGSWIAIDIGRIGASDATLRHVIAHEICHAREYMAFGLTTEIGADLCAGLHGAPRP